VTSTKIVNSTGIVLIFLLSKRNDKSMDPSLNASSLNISEKMDAVTALQDSIDLFSLSIFESLRQLRDATATGISSIEHSDDEDKDEEFSDMKYQELKQSRDESVVQRLASDVLKKSESIVCLTTSIPGINRTKEQQYEYIQQLLEENTGVIEELQEAKIAALKLREQIRAELQQSTALAINIRKEI
jgi:hypothetical protein